MSRFSKPVDDGEEEHSALDYVVSKEVNIKMGKTKLISDAEQGMIVRARTDDSNSETTILLEFSCPIVFRGLRE
ncbi:hypothetical protein TNIN_282201 [Trichonephila inaurata madagascariensis]|uniref:Uncharacterized protein n=1 Tax=Trichonephila inaurata madagascariensis TaxID=2747483 RepID=A0A8X6MJN5_9ARAC|nr:hypothetical protein TNIN_282201 [Trichonephila inaurata madagascariensis]